MRRRIIAAALVLTLIPLSAFAQGALETVRQNIRRVISILEDPALKGEPGRKAKKEKIRGVAQKMFDFTELSRRTVAAQWARFSPQEQKEFIELYQLLLEETYANKILAYRDEKISVKEEVPLSEKTVEVRTIVAAKSGDVPINYRVIRKGEDWRVYDVVIEGVSLISNYRSQFRQILSNNPPETLLERLRKKVGKG